MVLLQHKNETFYWQGEGLPGIQKRKPALHYRSFVFDNEEYEIGDFVLIRNDDSVDAEDILNCFVGQIKELYDTGDPSEPHQAKVQWFSRLLELPSSAQKQLDEIHDREVFEESRPQPSDVDADTIFSKCSVKFVPVDFDLDILESNLEEDVPTFFCRYKFNGIKLLPVIKPSQQVETPVQKSKFSVLQKTESRMEENTEKTPGTPSHRRRSQKYAIQTSSSPSEIKMKPFKETRQSSQKGQYCAIPTGTSDFPKVLIKRMDDRVLESQNSNVKIIVAKPDVKTIEDVTEALKNNLVLYNKTRNMDKRPVIHSFSVASKEQTENSTFETVSQESDIEYICDSFKSVQPSTPVRPKRSNSAKKYTSEKKTRSSSAKPASTRKPFEKSTFSETPNPSPKRKANLESVVTPVRTPRASSLRRSGSITNQNSSSKNKNNTPGKLTNDINALSINSPSKKLKSAKRAIKFSVPENDSNDSEMTTTRSGRKVKVANYVTEENLDNKGCQKSLFTSTVKNKKLSKFIRSNYSDDSGSEFSASESSSSDEEEQISDNSLEEKKSVTPSRKRSLKPRTPRSSAKKKLELSIPERKTPLKTAQNVLEESRLRLHVSAVPKSLPCREEEYSDIYSFVKGCLCADTGGCMYISGVPGTGKTATVHEAVRTLEEERDKGDVPLFNFVEVNGMWMTDPYQCYVQIFKSLTGKTIASQQAANLLEKRFTEPGPKKNAVVLLVDELDRLWTRKQTVMYNIFDWPSKKHSKLIVLAIANTMDLPERLMMNRISSRLGLTRKTFQPYNFRQLQQIIMSRIQELRVFDPDAVQFVARKVAAVSGDARRALDICRHATEVAEKSKSSPRKKCKILVGMEHVDEAIQQMFSSPVIAAIRSSSKLCKLFLQSMLSEFTRTGSEETVFLKVSSQIVSMCNFEGLQPPSSTEMFNICAQLAATHLILVDNFRNDMYMKLRLSVSPDDVSYALTGKG